MDVKSLADPRQAARRMFAQFREFIEGDFLKHVGIIENDQGGANTNNIFVVEEGAVLNGEAIGERAIATVVITDEIEGLPPKEKGVDDGMHPRDVGIPEENTAIELAANDPLAIATENDLSFGQAAFANDQPCFGVGCC